MKKLLSIAILTMACNPDPHSFPHELHVDSSFSIEEQEIIAEALDEWKEATDGIVSERMIIGIDSPRQHQVLRKSIHDDDVKRIEKRRGYTIVGWAWMEDFWGSNCHGPIWLVADRIKKENPDNYETVFKHVILHELGHHYGLEHASNKINALMSPRKKHIACITDIDLAQFCSLGYDCEGRQMKSSCGKD